MRTSLLASGGDSELYKPLTSASFSAADRRNFNDYHASQQTSYLPGGYHAREGLPTTSQSSNRSSRHCKMYIPNSRWTWAFALVSIFQAIIALAIEGYVFGNFETSLKNGSGRLTASRTIPTYLALFIFGFVYQLLLVWDALRAKNTIQVIGLCFYNVGMLVYSAINMNQVDEAIRVLIQPPNGGPPTIEEDAWSDLKPFLIAAPCVIALGTVLLSFIAWKLYHEFAWTIYKNISADLQLKRRYLTFQVCPDIHPLDSHNSY